MAAGTDTFIELAALAPPLLHAALARTAYATRLVNVTITNVPGFDLPRAGGDGEICDERAARAPRGSP